MDIVQQAEQDNSTLTYVPFVYNDIFPGFVSTFPQPITIKNVSFNGLGFMGFNTQTQYTGQQLNKAINDVFENSKRTKTLDSLALRIVEDTSTKELELHFHPSFKSPIPNSHDIIGHKGAHMHLQLNNLLQWGEQFKFGVLINQHNYAFLNTLRIPVEDSRLKIRLQQDLNQQTPLRTIEVNYRDLMGKGFIEMQVLQPQRSKEWIIENGIGVGLRFGLSSQNTKAFMAQRKSHLSIHCILWPKSTENCLSFKDQSLFNLHNKWNRLFAFRHNLEYHYSYEGGFQPKWMDGFRYLGEQNIRHSLVSESKLFFSASKLLVRLNMYPFINISMGFFDRVVRGSMGVGLSYKLNRFNIIMTYNLLHHHRTGDRPLKFEFNITK